MLLSRTLSISFASKWCRREVYIIVSKSNNGICGRNNPSQCIELKEMISETMLNHIQTAVEQNRYAQSETIPTRELVIAIFANNISVWLVI
jgi:hypothetical protein